MCGNTTTGWQSSSDSDDNTLVWSEKNIHIADFKSILALSKSAATKLHPGAQIHTVQADTSLPVSEEGSSEPHM